MKNVLTNPVKKRVISELRKILYDHPRYRADSLNVQNKFSFSERPSRGIIVNNTSSDRVRLSADNYIGRLSSFVMLAPVGNFPFTSLEWVRENFPLLEQFSAQRDVFPTAPGVYVIKITALPDETHSMPGSFTIDPILEVHDEPLITFFSSNDSTAQLSHNGVYPGSVRLSIDGRRPLLIDVDFSVDYSSGIITFLRQTPSSMHILADYKYINPILGPFPFNSEASDQTSIPGVVLAFGDRAQLGDQLAVVVSDRRVDTAEVYGGKFETTFELTIFSRDAEDREKMSDFVVVKMLEQQSSLCYDGIELLDISPGGETEDVYNQELDEYFYESTVSLTVRVDWESYIPLPASISRVELTSQTSEQQTGYLDGSFTLDQLQMYKSVVAIAGGITPLAAGFAQPLASGTLAPIGPGPFPLGSGPTQTQSPISPDGGKSITYEKLR